MPDATVLFELTELASMVQADLDEATATLARRDATALIQHYTGQHLFRVTDDEVRLPSSPFDRRRILLPQMPVVGLPTVVGEYFGAYADVERDGQHLYRTCLNSDGWGIRGGLYFDPWNTVTYTHGFSTIPDVIGAVARSAAARSVVNPSGVRQVTVGDVSTGYAGSDDDLVSGIFLTDREKQLLAPFRVRDLMVHVR